MKIAVGGIHTECSTYSSLLQTRNDFRVARGSDLLGAILSPDEYPADVEFLPLFHARATPGGPVSPECYHSFKDEFLSELKSHESIDGVLLIMHGAMHVPGMDDVEGDWIAAVREVVGELVPVAVSYDLHGNVTQKIIDAIDIFCAYRTAPHIDVRETHQRALRELLAVLRGEDRRMVAWAPIPVLLPGEKTSTVDEPTAQLYKNLLQEDQRAGVTDANLMVGYVWADTGRATAAAVVTGTNTDAIKKSCERISQGYWNARTDFMFGVPTMELFEAVEKASACETHPVVLADSGDNPTGGGVGDRSDVLDAWIAAGKTGAVFAGIADQATTLAAAGAGIGNCINVTIGGSLGSECPKVHRDAKVLSICGNATDETLEAALEIAGNTVIVTQRRRPFHQTKDIEKFGIELSETKVLVVKAGYLVTEIASIANPPIMALTDGAVSQDILALQNEYRPQPSFPFQEDFEFVPSPQLSKRAIAR